MSLHLFLLFIFLIFISHKITMINSVYVYIEPKEKFCLKKYRKNRDVLHVIYTISGEVEDRNVITVYDPNDFNMFKELDSFDNKVYLFCENEGYHKFCVENLASHQLTLSFYFGDENKDEKLSIKNVEDFVQSVNKITEKVDKLKFNVGNYAIKKKTHYDIAEEIRKKINTYTIIKIVFLLFFSIIQIILITSIFNKVKVVKKLEINNNNDNEEKNPLKTKTKDEFL